MKHDFSPFLGTMTLNDATRSNALAFAAAQPEPLTRLERILGAITNIVTAKDTQRLFLGTDSTTLGILSAALDTLTAAGSGIYALMDRYAAEGQDGHAAYSLATSWVAHQLDAASEDVQVDLLTAYAPALTNNTLGAWRDAVGRAGEATAAGTWLGWITAAQLLDYPHYLHAGDAEDLVITSLDRLRY